MFLEDELGGAACINSVKLRRVGYDPRVLSTLGSSSLPWIGP